MNLKIYNYLSRKKELFKPLKRGLVGFYACGPTVYDYAHIGNLRTFIFEDILRRALELNGYKVKMVMNITDIDDKTIRGAKKAGKTLKEFTDFYAKEFFKDVKKLNILPAAKYPRATRHLSEMKEIIKALLKKKYAYETEDGIYFDISKFKKYGRLSGLKKREPARPVGGLKPGARIAADEYSKNQAEDFALWKKKGPPAGGRPGWHLECSAMSMKYLGAGFDIHAGGVDLLFPHHENEIAQSEGATGKKFVNYFLEGEHLLVDGQKMSKSLGNILTLRDLEKKSFNPLAFRYLALSAHYRSRLNFTWKSLEAAQNSLERLYEFVRLLRSSKPFFSRLTLPRNGAGSDASQKMAHFREAFQNAVFNDLNTPKTLAVAWDIINKYHKNPLKFDAGAVLDALYEFDEMLGLGFKDLKTESPSETAVQLLKEREKARKIGNFKKADEIRERIRRLGWQINDTPSGSQLFHL